MLFLPQFIQKSFVKQCFLSATKLYSYNTSFLMSCTNKHDLICNKKVPKQLCAMVLCKTYINSMFNLAPLPKTEINPTKLKRLPLQKFHVISIQIVFLHDSNTLSFIQSIFTTPNKNSSRFDYRFVIFRPFCSRKLIYKNR